jgi:hypothetical protein
MVHALKRSESRCGYLLFTFSKDGGYPLALRSGFSERASALESRVGHGARTVGYGPFGGLRDNP